MTSLHAASVCAPTDDLHVAMIVIAAGWVVGAVWFFCSRQKHREAEDGLKRLLGLAASSWLRRAA